MTGDHDDSDHDKQAGNDTVESVRRDPRCPTRAKPGPEQASSQQVGDDRPMCGKCRKRHSAARNGRADATVTRLIALLRMTACRAPKRNAPIRSGNRNSAPPKPIRPPSAPMTAPPAKVAGTLRAGEEVSEVVVGMRPWLRYFPVTISPLSGNGHHRNQHCMVLSWVLDATVVAQS